VLLTYREPDVEAGVTYASFGRNSIRSVPMSLRHRFSSVAASVAVIATAGCASMHANSDVPPHPVTITVINNLMVPASLTLYAFTTGGAVQTLGTVQPTDSTQLQMTPRSFTEPYRLLVQGVLHGPRIWSDEFTIHDANTGEIRWSLRPNILQFYDVADDSAAAPPRR
jgi:hypothetical protein